MMSPRLRLLLFYLNYLTPKTDYSQLTAKKLREMNAAELNFSQNIIDYPSIPMHVEDRMIPMRDEQLIRIRIYNPDQHQKLPIIGFYHGGGFVARSIESHDKVCRRIAHLNKALVISVNYRMAPEHKFPGPVQDAYDAALWISQHGDELGGDTNRLIVMGDSAGGNLSTNIAILARDSKAFNIAYQVLIYPSTDARLEHPSIKNLGKGYMLTEESIRWYLDQYKSSDEDILNPMMSPLLTEDLSGLPPAFVATAQLDPLKDEAEAYVKRLKTAGNQVFFKEYPGVVHGFLNMPKITKQTLRMHEDIQQQLASVLHDDYTKSTAN